MEKYKIIFLAFFCTALFSCGDKLAELNENPNFSTSGGDGPELLTSGIGYYAIALEAYFNEDDAVFAQYWAGGPGVALIDIERYFIEPGDYNTEWRFSYQQALSDLQDVILNGNEALAAVADIYSVLIYQNLVDHYGDIPYTNALRGKVEEGGVLTPDYTDGKVVYDDLVARLDASILILEDTEEEVGDEDLIYAGDLTKWVAFANSLKLRLLMRQSINGDASIGSEVIELISTGTFIEDSVDMAIVPFTTGNNNPQYVRRESGIGQFYIASNTTVDAMLDINDPRLSVLYDVAAATGTIVGLDQGGIEDLGVVSADQFSFPSSVAYGQNNDVILMSHWEVKFLRAEAAMRYGTSDDEVTMFNEAVSDHFEYVGAELGTYLTADVVYDATASEQVKSDLIGVQKWIAMNGLQESEGWIESRRFDTSGTKGSTLFTEGILVTPSRSVFADGVFPSIRLYPQSELDFNRINTPIGRDLTDLVFWDN